MMLIEYITFFINCVINFFIITMDIYFTPEHSSDKKIVTRYIVLVLLCIFVYYMSFFSEFIYEGNYGIMLMHIGFLISSVCYLTYEKLQILKNK
jgi:hypothetical protein